MTYSVVQLGDERNKVSGIVYTDVNGEQRMIAVDIAEDHADKMAYLLNLTPS
jgi:hypothetical protein